MTLSVEQFQLAAARRVWAAQLERARTDVNVFVESIFRDDQSPGAPAFKQQWFHREWQRIWLEERYSVIHGATGFGKCLAPDTRVLRFDGTTVRADQVRDGDLLLGPDSQPRAVLGTTRGRGQMFRIVPIKGEPWVCNDVHVLTLVKSTTGEVVDIPLDAYLATNKNFKHLHKLFFPAEGIDFAPADPPPVDPYFLGVWFGDGRKSLVHGVEISKPDQEIEAACRATAEAWGLTLRVDENGERCRSYRIVGHGKGTNALLLAMRGLVGEGATVPEIVVRGSRETRLSFLAGFLDTDGYTVMGGIEIVQQRQDYADAIVFIAQSLGLRATRSTKEVDGTAYHRVAISGHTDRIPMRIARKRPEPRQQRKDPSRTGFTVEPIGEGDYAGFTLDGDGRFLLGDFTVTHNTEQKIGNLIFRMGQRPTIRIGLIGKTKDNVLDQVRKLRRQITDNPVVKHVFPKLLPGEPWGDFTFRVAGAGLDTTTNTVTALGIEGSPVGKRLDLIDCDDIVDDENTRTEEARETVIKRLDTALQSRLTTTGQMHITANAWDVDDAPHVYAKRPGIFHGVFPAISEAGELLWPDFRTREWLEEKRGTMTPVRFAQMFLCQASSNETRIFKDEWFQRARAFGLDQKPRYAVQHAFDHDWSLLDSGRLTEVATLARDELRVFIGVDLATGKTEKKRKTDLTVFFVLGVDSSGRRHVLWIEKGRWDAGESVRRLSALERRYRPVSVLVEDNATQVFFISYAREFASHLRIEPFTTTGEKWDASTGIEAIGIEMQAGKWVIPNPTASVPLSPQEQEALDNINTWAGHLRGFSRVGHTPDDVMASWFAQKGAARDGTPIFQRQEMNPVGELPPEWDPLRGWDLGNRSTVAALLDAPKVEIADDLPEIPDHIRKAYGLP